MQKLYQKLSEARSIDGQEGFIDDLVSNTFTDLENNGKSTPFQTNFTAGELTPKLAGQVDFKKYNNGVEELQNMTVFPQGGATRRYGSRFVAEVKDSSKSTRLIPFEFNITQAYN